MSGSKEHLLELFDSQPVGFLEKPLTREKVNSRHGPDSAADGGKQLLLPEQKDLQAGSISGDPVL